jgi:enoyl-CoA hydratase/carnithine racemase
VSSYTTITYERRNGAAWVTLNRPDALNSISTAMVAELDRAMDAAEADPDVRVVVIAAAGRAFCAGADLVQVGGDVQSRTRGGVDAFLSAFNRVLNRLEALPIPVIAALNGLALAGGLELVLCCDLVVAAESARIGDAHANYGLVPGGGNSIRLPRKIGQTRALYLMFTGEFVPAADLVAAGLVNLVVPDDQLVSATDELVQKLANKSPLGLARMKRLVLDGLEQPRETALRLEILTNDLHARSEDMQEGLAAFAEKRKPKFVGR